MSNLRPRRCVLEKAESGYGFHLHTDKGGSAQFIRLVEPGSPAEASGLLAGDRLMLVNGENVEEESHQQVVARIRATVGPLELIVVDPDTGALLSKHHLRCQKEFVTEGIALPAGDSGSDAGSTGSPRGASPLRDNGDASSESSRKASVCSSTEQDRSGPRPRLCSMRKGENGYGFNLHSKKSSEGQFIRAVDEDSPAARAGLKVQDKIVQVNGVPVLGMPYSEVVAAIRAGGDQTRLLVVDLETEEYFRRCNVQPSEVHLTGPLPVLVSERSEEEEEEISVERAAKESVSSSASSASIEAAAHSSSPAEQAQKSDGEAEDVGMGVSLAQAKERAHQKRAAKKAPQMDWRKRNELFSSL